MATSTITSDDVIQRVRARWGDLARNDIARAENNIGLCIWGGLERLGRVIKDSEDRQLLMKEITKAPTLGVIDLSHSDFNGVLIDTLARRGAVRLADASMPVKHAPTYDGLLAPSAADILWYHLTGKKLIFKNPATGALNTYANSLIYSVSFIPSLTDAALPLDDRLEDQLVDRVSEIVQKLGGLAFLKTDEEVAAQAVK
jgi:hypothetical protein